MATSAKTHNETASFDTAFEQFKDSGEQFLSYARKAGNAYLDSYEKAVDRAIELDRRPPLRGLQAGVQRRSVARRRPTRPSRGEKAPK